MGSEGRSWNGAAGVSGGEEKPTTAAVAAGAPADVPTSAASVDISLPLPEMTPRIIGLCKEMVKGWSSLDSSCFSIETVSGGITNLCICKEDNGSEFSVTVRLYGPNTDLVIDRKRELQAIPYLSAAGFGARLLGIFENGVVQSFIYARTLAPADMKEPKIAAEIAKELHSDCIRSVSAQQCQFSQWIGRLLNCRVNPIGFGHWPSVIQQMITSER